MGAIPANYDSVTNGPTYQYLQNETGHTGPQEVPSTYTTRPTNTSVNYIIKAKVVGDESDDLNVVNVVQNNNLNPITSNAVYQNWKQEYGQAISVTTVSGDSMSTSAISENMSMTDGNGVVHNLGTGGGHAFKVSWTTQGYILFIIDITVVAAIKGGTILTNVAN